MSESNGIIIEGTTLEDCRRKASAKLQVPADQIRLNVLQEGKKGYFLNTPFRVRATMRDARVPPKENAGAFENKVRSRVQTVMEEMEKLEILGKEEEAFESVLALYEDLPEDRRKEIREVAELLSSSVGTKVRERISRSGTYAIRVSDDKRTCCLDLTPPECMGAPVTLHDVLVHMRKKGITQGVNPVRIRELLELVLQKGQPIKNAVVAEGVPPQDGVDGSIVFCVAPGRKEAILQQDDRMDYRGKASIAVVSKGVSMARIVPPTPGTPGVNVYGAAIPAKPGSPAHLEAGANVDFDPDTQTFYSAIDGVMDVSDSTIKVHPTLLIREDVDMTTGVIEFTGDVRIGGTVRDGFNVHATGDIDIRGGVEGCEVVSKHGSITIGKGVAGHHRCFLSADRDVKVGYIENASVYAGSTIEVAGSILHSEVVAGDAVVVMRGKGSIMGGVTKAGHLVHVKRLGAPSETPTEVVVGINMDEHEALRQMDHRLVSIKNAATHLEAIIKEVEHGKQGTVPSSRKKERERLGNLKMKLVVLHHAIDQALTTRKTFLTSLTAQAKGTVKVSAEVYGHVTIRIGSLVEHVRRHLAALTFQANVKEGRIELTPYKSSTGGS